MIHLPNERRPSAFSVWLRTGRLRAAQHSDGVEFKFNPWHDPQNGRFTFANSGRYFGRRDGGGDFGGGGATGSWPVDRPRPFPRTAKPPVGTASAVRSAISSATARTPAIPSDTAEQFSEITRNGYTYRIDTRRRTRRVSGALTVSEQALRSRKLQTQAGGADRRPGDDGGHYIAVRFNGPTEAFNHFAQDSNVNRGRYRLLEDQWARAKRAGKRVTVKIVPMFDNASSRPSVIDVSFTIDGELKSQKLPNQRMESKRGK